MKKFIQEFKEFAVKGNVMDMAVGVIIGGAFGKIVSSLVDNVLMPLIGTLIGKGFEDLAVEVNGATIQYGIFLQNVVDFLIIAFCVFLMVKAMMKLQKPKEDEPAPEPTATEKLLAEIRDELKKQK